MFSIEYVKNALKMNTGKKAILSANFATPKKPREMSFLTFNLEALIMADDDEGILSHDS